VTKGVTPAVHGPKFHDRKHPAAVSAARLTEENRPAVYHQDPNRNDPNHRQGNNQQREGYQQVKQAFDKRNSRGEECSSHVSIVTDISNRQFTRKVLNHNASKEVLFINLLEFVL